MTNRIPFIFFIATIFIFSRCNNSSVMNQDSTSSAGGQVASPKIHEESSTFALDGKTYLCTIAYDENVKGKRPGILVIPEWWGFNDYVKSRARQLAALGYIAMATDMYGEGKLGNSPKEAQALATPFYQNPTLTKKHIDAAIEKIKTYPQTNAEKLGAIGYCFGGFVVLNAAKLGANLNGIVTFHGGLQGVKPDKNLIKAKILVCHGGADGFENPHVAEFKREMDSAGIDYEFKIYPDATHAFSNPEATAVGEKFKMPIKYNAAADTASWNDMKAFFKKIF